MNGRGIEKKFEKRNLKNVWRSGRYTEAEWRKMSKSFSKELKNYNLKFPESFSWKAHPSFGKKTFAVMGEMNNNLSKGITKFMRDGWTIANKKNNALASQYLRNFDIATKEMPSFFNANIGALEQFVDRSINGMDLSRNIWKHTDEAMDVLENFVGTGIATGKSADKIAKEVFQCLKEPNKYLTSIGAPPRGRYRSPYANSLRMARTETNMAYRMADHLRYKQMDFVVGIQVHLSGQHPKVDICDSMEGQYPKTFQFLGWHPNCFCYQTSVLASKEDFRNYLKGTAIPKDKFITGMTNRAQKYIKDNIERFASYKTLPYWIRNNRPMIEKAIKGPILPRAAKSKAYLESEKYWMTEGPNAYRPTGYGLEQYQKAMQFDSPEMDAILKRYGVSRNELYQRIAKTRQDLRTLKPSIDKFYDKKTGLFTPERQKVHDDIVKSFLEGKKPATGQKKMLMTGGYPGSGKSSMLNQAFPGWEEKFVHIDSDAIKNLLAKADGFAEVGWRASAYHVEAEFVLNDLMEQAVSRNMNVLFDGTMKSSGKLIKLMETYSKVGYKFEIAFAQLPMRKSMERAMARYLGKSGRFVDPLYIATHEHKNIRSFRQLKKYRQYVDRYVRYSTDVPIGSPAKLLEEGPLIGGKKAPMKVIKPAPTPPPKPVTTPKPKPAPKPKPKWEKLKNIDEAEKWAKAQGIEVTVEGRVAKKDLLEVYNNLKEAAYLYEEKLGVRVGSEINIDRGRHNLPFGKKVKIVNQKKLDGPFAEYLRTASDYAEGDSIFINLAKKEELNFAENAKDIIKRATDKKWLPGYNITSQTDAIIHELAHNYYFAHDINKIREFKKAFGVNNWYEKAVSMFGQENASEFFAEAVVSYMRGAEEEAITIIKKFFKIDNTPLAKPAVQKSIIPEFRPGTTLEGIGEKLVDDIPAVTQIYIEEGVTVDELNRVAKKLYDLERKGYMQYTGREMNLVVTKAKKGQTVGGSFQMYKYAHTGDARPNLKIVANYDEMLDGYVKKQMRSRKRSINKIKKDLVNYEKQLADYQELFKTLQSDSVKSNIEYFQERVDAVKRMLTLPEYSDEAVRKWAKNKVACRAFKMEEALIHEYGHILEADLQVAFDKWGDEVKDLLFKMKQENKFMLDRPSMLHQPGLHEEHFLSETLNTFAEGVSSYAWKNGAEYFAESWLKYNQGFDLDDKLLERLFDIITR